MKILLVEDEPWMAEIMSEGLTENGYLVDLARDGNQGRQLAREGEYDAIILDVMLPGPSGFSLCKEIRQRQSGVPVLMVTAKDSLASKLEGFECGADDYLTKPFQFPELLARLRSLLRRDQPARQRVLKVADLELDSKTREVSRSGRPIALTPKEHALLEYLMHNVGRVINRSQILGHVWATDYVGGSNVVDVFIRYLRRKVDDGQQIKLIHTVSGVGYVLREPNFES